MTFESCYQTVLLKTVVVIIGLCCSFKLFNHFYDLWFYSRIPGLKTVPLIGNTVRLLKKKREHTKLIEQLYREFENEGVYRVWIGTHPIISIFTADLLEDFCHEIKLNDKSFEYSLAEPWLKTGLVTSGGEKWAFRRKLITPSFHFDILKDYLLIMNEHSNVFIEALKSLKCKENVYLEHYIKALSLDIISEAAMGHSLNSQTDNSSEYLQAIQEMTVLLVQRMLSPWLWIDSLFKFTALGKKHDRCIRILQAFTKNIIQERADTFQGIGKTNKHVAFLDTLLDARLKNPKLISLDDIQEEVDTFMFEGHDTVSTAINWLCYNLATHPDVQEKVCDEVDNVLGNSNRFVTNDDLQKLVYLEAVIKESLRLFPSVPFIGRSCNGNAKLGKYHIKSGCAVIVNVFCLHRDKKYFPKPELFKPERFLSESENEKRPPFAYIPFSLGRRNCIGQKFAMMELKVQMAHLLKNFKLACDQTIEDIGFCFEIITRPEKPILISLIPRYI